VDRPNSDIDLLVELEKGRSLLDLGGLRNLQVLAESTQRLSEAFKSQHEAVEWHNISGLRNILVHDYLGIVAESVGTKGSDLKS
jgi:uncharacterized protein with HEPN domain